MGKRAGHRQVVNKGRFGVAYGGLSGDGDVALVMTSDAARTKLIDSFVEMLRPTVPQGQLVKTNYVTPDQARELLVEVERQLDGWRDTVDGDCIEVLVPVPGFTNLRCGIFRCFYGMENWPTRWWIPYQVRLDSHELSARKALDINEDARTSRNVVKMKRR